MNLNYVLTVENNEFQLAVEHMIPEIHRVGGGVVLLDEGDGGVA